MLATLKKGDKPPATPKMEEREEGEAAEQVGRMFGVGRLNHLILGIMPLRGEISRGCRGGFS